jgi:integrase
MRRHLRPSPHFTMLVFGRAKMSLHTFRIWTDLQKATAIGALIHMPKLALKIVSPDVEKRKVTPRRPKNGDVRTREYLTEREVEQLIEGCRGNRWPHRDQTMILLAFRHGLRASEVCDLQWTQVDFEAATLAVTRAKHGTPSTHPLPGAACAASPEPRGRRPIAVPVRVRTRLVDDGVQLPEAH